MGVFEHFPYVNFHELNFSWIVNKIKELEEVIATQIVDIVARAGVAANAQAINDLSDTVDANAVTAHNEADAAMQAATTADGKAVTAQNGVNALNTATTLHKYTAPTSGTLNANVDTIYRFNISENVKLVVGSMAFHTSGVMYANDILMSIPVSSNFNGDYEIIISHGTDKTMAMCVAGTKKIKLNGTIAGNETCFCDIVGAIS